MRFKKNRKRFHVEHDNFSRLLNEQGIILPREKERLLLQYAELVHLHNQRVNITGYRTLAEIADHLIAGSLSPLAGHNVPRGTFFCDMGTGGGVPGIPLGILWEGARGLLVDSHEKKVEFVKRAIDELHLRNLEAHTFRLEEMGHDPAYRGKFHWVLSRAMGNAYVALELGAPLLADEGYLYVYAHTIHNEVDAVLADHARELGLSSAEDEAYTAIARGRGLLFKKTGTTGERYPRRFAVLKREGGKWLSAAQLQDDSK